MSLVTTCPACNTAFRVTPEQLSAHRGDVRCGQCQHIFNGLEKLEEIASASYVGASVPTADEKPLERAPLDRMEDNPLLPLDQGYEETLASEASAENELAEDEATVEELDLSGQDPVSEDASEITPEPEADVAEAPLETPPASVSVMSEAYASSTAIPVSDTPPPPISEPVLLLPATKEGPTFWLLMLFLLMLLVGALAQSTYFLRTEIAAYYPPMRPWLEKACHYLTCTVELPRHADLLNIEDSDLQADPEHDGVLLLVSALYNRAPFPQAYPVLELTLTDTYDKPLLRRTFTPQEYLPSGTDIRAGLAAGSELHSRLPLLVDGAKPAGYRLYVRY